jgi:hypothetical protein
MDLSGDTTPEQQRNWFEIQFRSSSDKELFFVFESDDGDFHIPRTGEHVYLPRLDSPPSLYTVTQVTTVMHSLGEAEGYGCKATKCAFSIVICELKPAEETQQFMFLRSHTKFL